jgi:hypothetical protein
LAESDVGGYALGPLRLERPDKSRKRVKRVLGLQELLWCSLHKREFQCWLSPTVLNLSKYLFTVITVQYGTGQQRSGTITGPLGAAHELTCGADMFGRKLCIGIPRHPFGGKKGLANLECALAYGVQCHHILLLKLSHAPPEAGFSKGSAHED